MIPTVSIASSWSAFRGVYPLAGSAAYTLNEGGRSTVSWGLFATYELGYLAYFVAWEFLFRGWLINGLLPHWGRGPAILTQVLPFAVMHLGKAEPEALGSIIAAVALGVLAVRTRSFWYGAAVHGIVAIWMDWLSAWPALLGA
jgi:membrane protease YdiL (CAAX protease family)